MTVKDDAEGRGVVDPVIDGLAVAKAVAVAKRVFDYFKTRAKNAEENLQLMELQESFQTLRDDNTRLREELIRRAAAAAARGAYERRQIRGAVVLVHVEPDGTDGPPCCPKCRDDDNEPLPLQGLASDFRSIASHQCTSCKGTFNLY